MNGPNGFDSADDHHKEVEGEEEAGFTIGQGFLKNKVGVMGYCQGFLKEYFILNDIDSMYQYSLK